MFYPEFNGRYRFRSEAGRPETEVKWDKKTNSWLKT